MKRQRSHDLYETLVLDTKKSNLKTSLFGGFFIQFQDGNLLFCSFIW